MNQTDKTQRNEKKITMADLVTLTVDGVEVTVPKGTYVVDAAKRVDIDIPVFCYHPKMEPVGMCRMCLVEIGVPLRDRETGEVVLDEDGNPKINFGRGLQTGCTVPVSEGMVVRTTTDEVTEARDDIIEFLLTSHPLDCPICDKGGECPLQNLTMRHGEGVSRMDFTLKKKLAKTVPLGELIMLDRERCIQCARCVRYQDELVDDPVIAFHQRGRSLEIVTNSDPGFDSIFSGNTTDICPVGALTSVDFRFGARPWEMTPVASICTHCPVGCNTTLDTRREARAGGRTVIKRIMPRQNEMVNEIWMCDKGRFVHHYADHPQRLTEPLVRRNGELQPASWDEALDLVASKLQEHKASVAGLSGDRLSNEDLFLFQRLFRDGLGSNNIALADPRIGGADVIAAVGVAEDTNLHEMGEGDAILVVASDMHQEAPIWWFRIKQATERGVKLIVLNARPTRLDPYATHSLRFRPGGALEMAQQLLTTARVAVNGDQNDPIQAAASALVHANNVVAFYGGEGLTYDETETLAQTLANLLLLKDENGNNHVGRPNNGLVAVWPHNNTQGAWDMGIRPDAGPGYRPLDEGQQPGMPLVAIYDAVASGDLSALYVMGADPIGDGLLQDRGGLDFLVVQELFLTETAQAADVVFPARSWAEREGTFTSGERRVQRFYPAIPVVGDSRADWRILADLGERFGLGEAPYAAGLVFRQIAESVPQYSHMTYRSLGMVVEQWPRVGGDDLYYGGTSYDNKSGIGQQWASFSEAEDASIELYSVSGEGGSRQEDGIQVIAATALYREGTLINLTEILSQRIVPPTLVLHESDAAELELEDGDIVTVALAGSDYRLLVKVDSSITHQGLALAQGVTLPPRQATLQVTSVEKKQALVEALA